MNKNVYKFLDNYVAVMNPKPSGVEMHKMSYLDFYKMLRDTDEIMRTQPESIAQITPNDFYEKHIEKYDILQTKLGIKRNPLYIKQYRFNQAGDFYMTLELGKKGNYLMDRKYDEEMDYVNIAADKSSIYLVVLKVGFTTPRSETSKSNPNKLECTSVMRKEVKIVDGKPKTTLNPIPYLKNKVADYLNDNINDIKGSKIKLIKDTLTTQELSMDSILRLVTEKDLSNPTFVTALEKSIQEHKEIDWKGVEY